MSRSIFGILAVICFVCVPVTAGHCDEILTWRACVNYALKHNPDLQSSMELINKNKATEGIARSGYLPKIDANIGLTTSTSDGKTVNTLSDKARQIFSTLNTNNSIETVTNPLTYGVSGSQLIFDGMKTVYDIKAARSNTEDAKYQYEIKSALVRYD
ncbi:MAG: TolC family protein [Legionellales bacterium]